ncbi:MAG: LON peptidase substrate-binding domain-containing protein [Rubellimicrobium sp.]|nr:LON peptidase substrate-binding domain-containing protein [Rubellimicrobium sp.]
MTRRRELPGVLPVFPLPGALLLPRARLPLHLFEPRYLMMLDHVLATPHRLIGMIQPLAGSDDAGLSATGCAGRVTAFQELDDGRCLITLTGISRFHPVDEVPGTTPWRNARVDYTGFERDQGGPDTDPDLGREGFLDLLDRYFRDRGLSGDIENLRAAEDETLIDSLSMLLPFGHGDRQALLEAPGLADRRAVLVALLEYALHGGENDEVLQ